MRAIEIAAFVVLMIALPAFGIFRAITDKTPVVYRDESTEPTHVCRNCGSHIQPVERKEGSGVVEVLLWLVLLIPGVIYSIWRASTRKPKCPICAAPHPIPLGTPAADALTSQH